MLPRFVCSPVSPSTTVASMLKETSHGGVEPSPVQKSVVVITVVDSVVDDSVVSVLDSEVLLDSEVVLDSDVVLDSEVVESDVVDSEVKVDDSEVDENSVLLE